MRIGVVYMKPRKVAYVRRTGPYSASSAAAWQDLTNWIEEAGIRPLISCGYGLSHDAPGKVAHGSCRYDACVEIPDGFSHLSTFGLAHQTLPGGAFARLRHVGRYDQLRPSILSVRDAWLPSQPHLCLDTRRPLMVVYMDDPVRRERDALRCDVCVPVRTYHDASVSSRADTQAAANDLH